MQSERQTSASDSGPGESSDTMGSRVLEPSMYLQRPSTQRSQDVRHILARVFRDLYTKEVLRPETIQSLQTSAGSDDPYHEHYVQRLKDVYDEWNRRMEEAAMLERHIMQAQARAMSADERDLIHSSKACRDYDKLGLPSGRAHFTSCIDTQLLRDHFLITPEDYSTAEPIDVPIPSGPDMPPHTRETVTSQQHSRQRVGCTESRLLPPISMEDGECIDLPTNTSELESTISDPLPPPANTQPGSQKFPSVDAWKGYMSSGERQGDRCDLTMLDAKVNYLRNPRFIPPAESGNKSLIRPLRRRVRQPNISQPPDAEPEEDVPIFIASPAEVVFKDYKVGQVYEINLELKNVSTVMRHCRAYPPSTSYFSVGLGQFPGDKSLVAPGISCLYPLRFAPDSLRDFDDEIVIHSQSSKQLIVPLKGRRNPPCLTIPPVLDVGYCLVGGFHITQFAFRNQGGPGRFCVMPRSFWPAINFKSVIQNGSVSVGPFEVRPSTFELETGGMTLLEVMFRPGHLSTFTNEVSILCDNCHVQHFTIKGESQLVRVSLEAVDQGQAEPMPGELCDRSAQHLIKFDDLNPFTYTERVISIKNHTKVALPFQWMVYKPQMPHEMPVPPELVDGENLPVLHALVRDPEEDRVPEVDSVFSVQPFTGTLLPEQTAAFRLTFAPPVVSDFHNVAHLLIQQVPPISRVGVPEDNQLTPSPMLDIAPSQLPEGPGGAYRDLSTLELELKGRSIPLNVVLHPYALYLPGSYLLGSAVKRLFTMANHSFSTITFQWEPLHDSKLILEVEPPFGELDPGMAMDLELSMTGTVQGPVSHTLLCHVLNLQEPLHLHVEATIKGPEVLVEEPSLHFGLVKLGHTVSLALTLSNMVQMSAKWTLRHQPPIADHDATNNADTHTENSGNEFTFHPDSGELRPFEQMQVTVEFCPLEVKSVHRTFLLEVEGGNTVSLSAFAEVQKPLVCLMECEMRLEKVFVGVPVVFSAVLFNQTLLPAVYKWGQVEGAEAAECTVLLEEPSGVLNSREEYSTKISFCPHRQGDYNEVRIPCTVQDQEIPLYLSLRCTALTLSVKYMTSDDGEQFNEELSMDFGKKVRLGETVTRYLYICNETAIAAKFSVAMEVFASAIPSPPSESRSANKSSTRQMLAHTPNLADPLSKTPSKIQSELKAAVLGRNVGAAFVLQPSQGHLQPFQQQVIQVTAYSNMWGAYSDNIVCTVGDLDVTSVPVSMTVEGCPINFRMTAANPDQTPIVRFGTLMAGTPPVTRHIRINNSSPFDIRLDWKVYNLDEVNDKLVDFIVWYGRAFPRRNSQGSEVLPKTPEPPVKERPSSGHLPNSPDTISTTCSSRARSLSFAAPKARSVSSSEARARHKIVHVYLGPHNGREGFTSFNIHPRQMTVRAKGQATVAMTFVPPSVDLIAGEVNYISYALGFLSLDSPLANMEGKVVRKEAFNTEKLRIDYTALIKPALLTIEEADDEGMVYETAMSEVLGPDDKLIAEAYQYRSVMLTNNTEAPLTFRLLTKQPFFVRDWNPDCSCESGVHVQTTHFHTLMPQHSLTVSVGLRVWPSMVNDILEQDALLEDAQWPDESQQDSSHQQEEPSGSTDSRPAYESSSHSDSSPPDDSNEQINLNQQKDSQQQNNSNQQNGSQQQNNSNQRNGSQQQNNSNQQNGSQQQNDSQKQNDSQEQNNSNQQNDPQQQNNSNQQDDSQSRKMSLPKKVSQDRFHPQDDSPPQDNPNPQNDSPPQDNLNSPDDSPPDDSPPAKDSDSMADREEQAQEDSEDQESPPQEKESTPQEQSGELGSVAKSHYLYLTDDLYIEFNNLTQQVVPLQARVAVPQMTLSREELDFGVCLVGQRRELQLLISNTTSSHSSWRAVFEKKSGTCVTDTFQISPTHGRLEASITHVSHSNTLLSVFFTAKHSEHYEAVILFTGILGEEDQRLYVTGQGSYDGKHQAILNI